MSSVAGKLNIAAFNWSKENMLKKRKRESKKRFEKNNACVHSLIN